MAMPTAQAAAQKWAQNLGAATDRIKTGVMAVSTSPTAKAAAASAAFLAGIQNAVSSGKWQNSLQAVSLGDWQNAMTQKGIPRIASGATQSQPKFQAFMSQWLPYLQNGLAQLQATPRGGLEQNIARMVSMARYNAQFKYNRAG